MGGEGPPTHPLRWKKGEYEELEGLNVDGVSLVYGNSFFALLARPNLTGNTARPDMCRHRYDSWSKSGDLTVEGRLLL